MEVKVVKISKIEKSTDQGIKDIFAVQLEGDELLGENLLPVHVKLIFSCETLEPLTTLVNVVIGDKRTLALKAVNHELDDFAEPEKEEAKDPQQKEGQTILETGTTDAEQATVPAEDVVKETIQNLLAWDDHLGGSLEDYLVNNFKKDVLTGIARALHLAVPRDELPQKTAFNIAVQIAALKSKQQGVR